MTDAEYKSIERECVEQVRKALKTITRGEIYDEKGYLNKVGYDALEEIEGLDLFWICDPLIKLAKESDALTVVDCKNCDGYEAGYSAGVRDTERPQGEWLEDKVAFHFVCNQCGCALRQLKSEVFEGDYDYNFCPNCGASMKPKPNQLRDCENCIHHSENGCEVWECEFKRRSS